MAAEHRSCLPLGGRHAGVVKILLVKEEASLDKLSIYLKGGNKDKKPISSTVRQDNTAVL